MKLTEDDLKYWGSEENFTNHDHCDDTLGPIYHHEYVKELTTRIERLRKALVQIEAYEDYAPIAAMKIIAREALNTKNNGSESDTI